jgi:hypothetical protein
MGHLGAVAMGLGRAFCQFENQSQFRLVCNFGSLALQTQSHAHMHILGERFISGYPDLRHSGHLIYEDHDLRAFTGKVGGSGRAGEVQAIMVVPRTRLSQDEFFAGMQLYGARILQLADTECGSSYRLLAEVGPHSPTPHDGAHVFILGGTSLGHYI